MNTATVTRPGRMDGYCFVCGRFEDLAIPTKLCTTCTVEWLNRRVVFR